MTLIPIDTIKVNIGKRRPIIPGIVKTLVTGTPKDGLRTPLTVRLLGGVAHLVTGFQRLEALKALGWEEAPCLIIRGKGPAQRWRIVENLHRGELTKLERAKQTKALLELEGDSEEISGEKVQKNRRGRPEGGDAKAARTLPVRGRIPTRNGRISPKIARSPISTRMRSKPWSTPAWTIMGKPCARSPTSRRGRPSSPR